MESKCKRFLVLLATVVLLISMLTISAFAAQTEDPVCYEHGDVNADGVVDVSDAIYTLYHSVYGDDFPVNQDCDFAEDGKVNLEDALYLLWASMDDFFEDSEYTLKGTIHGYYEPVWQWDAAGTTASVSFKCACAEGNSTLDATTGVTVTSQQTAAATCVAAGSVECAAKVTFNGQEYSSEKTVVIPAAGHELSGTATCTEGVSCANCDYAQEALGHVMELDAEASTAATCTASAVQVYQCASCDHTESVTLAGELAHTWKYREGMDEEYDGCTFVRTYECATCGEVKEGEGEHDRYTKHSITTALTVEATCSATGIKTHYCPNCDYQQSEVIPKNDSHAWNDGVTADGITTYTCADCGKTKTAVSAENGAAVDKAALDAVQELQLDNDTAIRMDDAVKEQFAEEDQIAVSVDTVALSETKLSEAEKAQVGDNTVYDFTLTVNGEPVSEFAGAVTVSLPYTLQDGDDINSIDVWYIADSGKLERMDATYSSGYVTFTTDHFSYYTVTRLTPTERCARYGHSMVEKSKAVTCTEDGYVMNMCQRCGYVESKTEYPMTGHNYQDTANAVKPTCTEAGHSEQACTVCDHVIKGDLPATGHRMEQTAYVEATCSAPGESVHACANEGCSQTLKEVLPQLAHDFEIIETEEADCVSGGYEKGKCSLCGQEEIIAQTTALGHDFQADSAVWTWNADHSEATVTLKCARDDAHTQTLNAVITEKLTKATCETEGSVVYTATASFNKVTVTDTYTETVAATGHKPAAQWQTNANAHYHVCSVCEARVATEDHTWTEGVVTKEPTCVTAGMKAVACSICGYEAEKSVPATGKHNFVNRICTECGYEDGSCDHLRVYRTEVGTDAYDICEGFTLWRLTCACGKNSYLQWNTDCKLGEEYYKTVVLENGNEIEVSGRCCEECGLTIEYAYYGSVDEELCLRQNTELQWISIDDTLIAEGTYFYANVYDGSHPRNYEKVETVDLSQYGMCGDILRLGFCYCGEHPFMTLEDEKCIWRQVGYEGDDYSGKQEYICAECGAEQVFTWKEVPVEGTCETIRYDTYSYYLNGKEVYSCPVSSCWDTHEFREFSCEMDGTSCEDGVMVIWTCELCGEQRKNYTVSHELTMVDWAYSLNGAEICCDEVVRAVCACGKVKNENLNSQEDFCQWNYLYEDESGIFAVCEVCGATRQTIREVTDKKANCEAWITVTDVYTDRNGNYITTTTSSWEGEDHANFEETWELLGESCEDGILIVSYCTDCGEQGYSNTEYGHIGMIKQTYDLSALDMCTKQARSYACACGKDQWFSTDDGNDYCQFEWVDSNEEGYTEKCSKCGTTMHVTMEDLDNVDPCHVNCLYTRTFTQEGKEPVVITHNQVNTSHGGQRYALELLDGADDCEDGYTVHMTCSICGAEEDHGTHYGHSGWEMDRQTLYTGDQLCGKADLVTYDCACGQEYWKGIDWHGGNCVFEYTDFDALTQTNISTCTTCGAVRTQKMTEMPIEGESCKVTVVFEIACNQNDIALFNYSYDTYNYRHTDFYAFDMQGQTCEEGYYLLPTCIICGESRRESYLQSGCIPWPVEMEQIYNGADDCGPIYLSHDACPCGQEESWNISSRCEWQHMEWDAESGFDLYECMNCGLQRKMSRRMEATSNGCMAEWKLEVMFLRDETVVASAAKEYTAPSHDMVTDFRLMGESCEDGYYVIRRCSNCDYAQEENWLHKEHEVFRTANYDLSDYGMCPGNLYVESCACGKWSNVWWDMSCVCPAGRSIEEDEMLGVECNECIYCGTMFRRGEVGEIDKDTCWYTGTFYFKIYDENNDYKLDLAVPISHESHEMNVLSMELMDPNGDCESGYIITNQCVNCDMITTERGYGHYVTAVKHIDLTQYGACGGYVDYNSCACGAYSDVFHSFACADMYSNEQYWNEEVDGTEHEMFSTNCVECGLTYSTDRYEVPTEDPCYTTVYYNKTFQLGEALNETFYQTWEGENHDTVDWYVLLPGSETCEDGVEHWRRCKVCGNEYREGVNYYHAKTVVDSIDLIPYGSVCGAQLNHYACACGAQERYDIDENSLCQLERRWTENWIEDALNDHQMTTDGGWNYYSDSYIFTCAVTDPDCDLSIRMSEYWLKEGCMAVEYQIWQLGYDAATGTFQEELKIPTGERHAYHNYEVVHSYENPEEGTDVEIDTFTCVDCGSTYVRKDYFIDSYQAKVTEDFVNTLWEENGEPRERHYVIELYELYNGYRFETLSRTDVTYADGSTWWEQNVYEYNFDNGCSCIRTYSDSNGTNWSEERDAHQRYQHDEWIKEPTCTQYGIMHRYWECPACETILEERNDQIEPYAHDWNWDDEKQTYVCSRCSLENINGASGEIVLEDMSEKYGTGTNTVIGYWIRENVEYNIVFSVILEDMEGDNERFLDVGWALWSVEENGVNALVFDTTSAQVEAEAKIAEAGYTGSYAIRVALVPVGSGNTLDYAITFDSQTAA